MSEKYLYKAHYNKGFFFLWGKTVLHIIAILNTGYYYVVLYIQNNVFCKKKKENIFVLTCQDLGTSLFLKVISTASEKGDSSTASSQVK